VIKSRSIVMDRRVSRKMSKHQKRGIAAAYRHERSRPAVTYDVNVSTQDVGIAHDFQCVVWLAFYSFSYVNKDLRHKDQDLRLSSKRTRTSLSRTDKYQDKDISDKDQDLTRTSANIHQTLQNERMHIKHDIEKKHSNL